MTDKETQLKPLRIIVGGDDAGYNLKTTLLSDLSSSPLVSHLIDIGPHSVSDKTPYPHFAVLAARKIIAGEADRALLICGTGLGVAIAANKVKGIRAVTAHDAYSVERAVKSNDAQVLCLGERVVGVEVARKLVQEWVGWRFDVNSSSAEKVKAINEYDEGKIEEYEEGKLHKGIKVVKGDGGEVNGKA